MDSKETMYTRKIDKLESDLKTLQTKLKNWDKTNQAAREKAAKDRATISNYEN